MIIHGLQKTSLLDFPGRVCATIFLGGCNFRCPFCHNMNLVLNPQNEPVISEEELMKFLTARQGILDGVCITGGEPTLHKDLPDLVRKIRALGYSIKLDTNGSNPRLLKELVEDGLLDYVAMDIKSAPGRYARVCGLDVMDFTEIHESIRFLLSGFVPYEFRTTVVNPYHTPEVMEEIGRLIQGADRYFLQSFVDSDFVRDHSLAAYDKDTLLKLADIVRPFVKSVSLRGVD